MAKTAGRSLAVLALAGLLGTAGLACSSDDESSEGSGSQADIAAALVASSDGEVTDEQADCMASALIDSIGEEEAAAFAEDPDAWTAEQVQLAVDEGGDEATADMDALGDAMTSCGLMDDADVEDGADMEDGADLEDGATDGDTEMEEEPASEDGSAG